MQKMINIYSSNFDNIPFTCMIITSVTFYLLYTQNDINSDVGGYVCTSALSIFMHCSRACERHACCLCTHVGMTTSLKSNISSLIIIINYIDPLSANFFLLYFSKCFWFLLSVQRQEGTVWNYLYF